MKIKLTAMQHRFLSVRLYANVLVVCHVNAN